MNILAIDAITPILSVCASGPNGKVTVTLDSGDQHASHIITLAERAMEIAGFSPRETALVAVAEGPGSFTGLRLAYSAAKAIVLAANAHLVPVPPLDCYARAAVDWPGAVVSVLDAKKSRFYARVFRQGQPMTEPLDIAAQELSGLVDPEERVLIVGPDASVFAEAAQSALPQIDVTAMATGTSGIAADMVLFAESASSAYTIPIPDHAGPVYVRKSDAEINSTERK
jgi:tRNA threonylcarbamoyladenosine biosynthesis protein TsaB